MQIALAHYDLHRSPTDEPYALRRGGPLIAVPLRGSRIGLRVALARGYRNTYGRAPRSAALADAMAVIDGHALDAPARPVHLRVGWDGATIIVDLGRPDGVVVQVDATGWRVRAESPIVFRRTPLTGELPLPESGGSLDELRPLIAVTDETFPGVLGWLVAAFLPDIAHPVLLLGGGQGAGKTTAARALVSLVDASPVPVRAEPRDLEGWTVAASGSWFVAVDNVSVIPPWWSDAICRAVSGEGLVRRALYTDADVSVIAYRRCVIITSIDAGALRGDLGDRILFADLAPIGPSSRRTDMDLDAALARARPRILGALLDLLVKVLDHLPSVRLVELPRMADYACVLAAMDAAMGTDALMRYLVQAYRVAADVVDGDPVAGAIRDLGAWHGLMGELHRCITTDRPPHGWPANPRAMGARLRRLAPALERVGITVRIAERTAAGIPVTITRVDR